MQSKKRGLRFSFFFLIILSPFENKRDKEISEQA